MNNNKNKMEYQLYSLSNGIKVLHKPSPLTDITHSCIVINSGSRDEEKGKDGLAHFIEHLLFKGTSRRSTYQLLNRLEVVGGDINAYTTKEQTCVHASFLNQHLERAIDLFTDILFHSTFPVKEMKKEKEVILDEIDSYLDLPEEAIQDDFEALLFKKHSLGNNILGTAETVNKLTSTDIHQYIKNNYKTDEIILGVYGGSDFNKIITIAEKYLGGIKKNNSKKIRQKPLAYKPSLIQVFKPIVQSHAMIGNRCYSTHHKNKVAMLLLNNFLGGPGMSSKLNLEIREKHGICYSIESNYIPFSDTGTFSIYMGTDKDKMDKCQSLVNKELKKLRENKLGSTSLQQAKQKFIGQISLAEESRLSVLLAISKNILEEGKSDSLELIYKEINAITSSQILEVCNEIFDPKKLSYLTFSPEA